MLNFFLWVSEKVESLIWTGDFATLTCNLLAGIDQYDRDSIINDFKNGTCKLLVATSVAARGLDVKHLILVVNYSCPNHYEDYVHRAGRTGRAGNKVKNSFRLIFIMLKYKCLLFQGVINQSYGNTLKILSHQSLRNSWGVHHLCTLYV